MSRAEFEYHVAKKLVTRRWNAWKRISPLSYRLKEQKEREYRQAEKQKEHAMKRAGIQPQRRNEWWRTTLAA